MKSAFSLALLGSLPWLPLATHAQFQAGDDFNHANRDVAKWGAVDSGTGDSEWVESSNRLQFLAPSSGFSQSLATRVWQGRSPSYTNDWQVTVDLQLNEFALFEGEGASVSVQAGDANQTDNLATLSLQYFKVDDSTTFRQLQADVFAAGETTVSQGEPFVGRSASLRLSYDAHSRMLTMGLVGAGNVFRAVASWDTAFWNMNSESSFRLSIGGVAFGASVGSGQITADNFSITEGGPRAIATLAGEDNFNDQNRSLALWGPLDATLGAGRLEEVGGATRFSTLGESGGQHDRAVRYWFPGAGNYSKSWSAQVDVTLPNLPLGEGNEVELGLMILNLADPGDRATVSLDLTDDFGALSRRFKSDLRRDGVTPDDQLQFTTTTSISAALRARWDAASKRLILEIDSNGAVGGYQWTNLRTLDLGAGDSNWELSAASRFQIGIFGESYVGTMVPTSAGLILDNFIVSSEGGVVTPVKLAPVKKVGSQLQLSWTGGQGPFQVQRRNAINVGAWTNVGATQPNREASMSMAGGLGFFRILDLGQ
ncbi:MAG: hypothetical protein JNN07_07500 [Verrucomicrobiales bacterium]|nr:hypothetical protein [Verrucomicrobiales bacterium]